MRLKFIYGLCAILAMGFAATSCSDDDDLGWDDSGSEIELPAQRMYILNEGTMKYNNANISLYNPGTGEPKFVDNIFFDQNGMALGEVAQDMIEYNNNLYVSVYGSNMLLKLNTACVLQKMVTFAQDSDLQGKIRYIAAEGGYIYASFYGGIVAKFNASDLSLVKKLKIAGGFNLEGVVIENNCLYVANSYEKTVDPTTGKNKYNYLTDVFVVDLNSFTLKQTVTVSKNPNQLIEEDDKVFLISWNYSAESYVFQMIDPAQNNAVSELGYATNMTAGDDVVYLVDSRTDYSSKPYVATNTFKYYDINSGRMVNSSFLKNAPTELTTASVYSMSVNDNTGDIYILTTNYDSSNGVVYRFDKNGNYVEKFNCGGQNPRNAVFFN